GHRRRVAHRSSPLHRHASRTQQHGIRPCHLYDWVILPTRTLRHHAGVPVRGVPHRMPCHGRRLCLRHEPTGGHPARLIPHHRNGGRTELHHGRPRGGLRSLFNLRHHHDQRQNPPEVTFNGCIWAARGGKGPAHCTGEVSSRPRVESIKGLLHV